MDAYKIVVDDLQLCIRKAMKLGILTNPRTSGEFYNNRIAISSKYTRFTDEADYLENYFRKYEQGEYLVALNDGAFFQINYEFQLQGKKTVYLEKMNLCYLPPVNERGELRNEYIRIDFSNSPDNSFFHAYAHVHIGFRNSIRIPIDEVVLFSEFLNLILYLFYPEQFALLSSDTYRMSNTKDKTKSGRLTKDKVLTQELEQYFYLKTVTN